MTKKNGSQYLSKIIWELKIKFSKRKDLVLVSHHLKVLEIVVFCTILRFKIEVNRSVKDGILDVLNTLYNAIIQSIVA